MTNVTDNTEDSEREITDSEIEEILKTKPEEKTEDKNSPPLIDEMKDEIIQIMIEACFVLQDG